MRICVKDATPLRDSTDKEYERPEYETKCFPNQSSRLWREGPGGGWRAQNNELAVLI